MCRSTGSRTTVNVSQNRNIEEAECSLCGQCITHCPVNALHVREDSEHAFEAFNDPDKITDRADRAGRTCSLGRIARSVPGGSDHRKAGRRLAQDGMRTMCLIRISPQT